MKYSIYILVILLMNSCDLEKPKICEYKISFSKVLLKSTKNNCDVPNIGITEEKELSFIFDELCKSEKKFVLNRQGDLWYVNIYIDGLNKHKLLSLTKTVHGTYYFRDEYGTYSNNKLAKKIVELTGVECE
jgi:hypothetical protein